MVYIIGIKLAPGNHKFNFKKGMQSRVGVIPINHKRGDPEFIFLYCCHSISDVGKQLSFFDSDATFYDDDLETTTTSTATQRLEFYK